MTVRELICILKLVPEDKQDLPVYSDCGDPYETFEVGCVTYKQALETPTTSKFQSTSSIVLTQLEEADQ